MAYVKDWLEREKLAIVMTHTYPHWCVYSKWITIQFPRAYTRRAALKVAPTSESQRVSVTFPLSELLLSEMCSCIRSVHDSLSQLTWREWEKRKKRETFGERYTESAWYCVLKCWWDRMEVNWLFITKGTREPETYCLLSSKQRHLYSWQKLEHCQPYHIFLLQELMCGSLR